MDQYLLSCVVVVDQQTARTDLPDRCANSCMQGCFHGTCLPSERSHSTFYSGEAFDVRKSQGEAFCFISMTILFFVIPGLVAVSRLLFIIAALAVKRALSKGWSALCFLFTDGLGVKLAVLRHRSSPRFHFLQICFLYVTCSKCREGADCAAFLTEYMQRYGQARRREHNFIDFSHHIAEVI